MDRALWLQRTKLFPSPWLWRAEMKARLMLLQAGECEAMVWVVSSAPLSPYSSVTALQQHTLAEMRERWGKAEGRF